MWVKTRKQVFRTASLPHVRAKKPRCYDYHVLANVHADVLTVVAVVEDGNRARKDEENKVVP